MAARRWILGREASLCAVILSLIALRPLAGQVKQADPANAGFVVVSITRSNSATAARGSIRTLTGGVVRATNVTLVELIKFAYQRHAFDDRDVVGGPAWVTTERFDVLATVSGDHVFDADGLPRRTLVLLKALLGERFHLKLREEERIRQVYVLTMASETGRLGPNARRSEIDCGAVMRGAKPPLSPGQGPPCGFKTPPGRLFANTFTMPAIASLLTRHVDRPVIDRTGLSGRFDIELEAKEITAPPGYTPGPSDLALPPAAGPTIFVAVREQLGLKLEPHDAPVTVLVIDSADPAR